MSIILEVARPIQTELVLAALKAPSRRLLKPPLLLLPPDDAVDDAHDLQQRCSWATLPSGETSTGCNENRLEFDTGTLRDNGFKFCPFCGLVIEHVNFSDGGEFKRAKNRQFQ